MTTKENLVRLNQMIAELVADGTPESDPGLQTLRAAAKSMDEDYSLLRLYAFLACCIAAVLAAACILCGAIFAMQGELAKSTIMQHYADISVIAAMVAYWAMRK